MTAVAKARFRRYLHLQEERRQDFIRKIKELSPKEKNAILVEAGVLTRQGKFTARYRTAPRRAAKPGTSSK
jgi:hypothetical protein